MVALPWGSRSISSTRRCVAASEAARLTAVVVFPTPPFWFATAMIRFIRLKPYQVRRDNARHRVRGPGSGAPPAPSSPAGSAFRSRPPALYLSWRSSRPPRPARWPGHPHEFRERAERAGDRRCRRAAAACRTPPAPGPPPRWAGRRRRHRMAHEFGLLAGGLDERIAPVRVRDRERQARKARAGADVRDREATRGAAAPRASRAGACPRPRPGP